LPSPCRRSTKWWLYSSRERNSYLGFQLDNGRFQVLFQNSSGANPASYSVGTVDSFLEFKASEAREQNTTNSDEV